jgi:hypothetical protein
LGVKVTLNVQLDLGANELPQVPARLNAAALVPEIVTLVMLKVPVPEFSKVTVCAGLVVSMGTFPKETLVGEMVATNWLLTAEKPVVLETPKMASTVRAASRIVGLTRADWGGAPPVWGKGSA